MGKNGGNLIENGEIWLNTENLAKNGEAWVKVGKIRLKIGKFGGTMQNFG